MKYYYINSNWEKEKGHISYIWGILFLFGLLGVYRIVYTVDNTLPTPLKIEDEDDYPDSFIAERAKNYLKPLIELGPRVTGSKTNEECSVTYLIETIDSIKKEANLIHNIQISLQSVSGSFLLDDNKISAYANIQNVVVKISSCNDTSNSILLNTHFDTVPFSSGGSGNGVNVAIALEVLRKVSQLEYQPRNNIIFLFNGAEEADLVASHGFITQHKWSEDVVLVINLDAAGAGGKELLFQVGPEKPWLFDYYNVPHPSCNVLAEEIFESSLLSSKTDFDIFHIFGGIVGYNMAFYKDGHRHHTKYDRFENIEDGRYQHTGDNVLHLVKSLAEAAEIDDPMQEKGSVIFFDFLGLVYVHYNANLTATVISIITILLSIASMIWTSEKYKIDLMSSLVYLPATTFVKLLAMIMNCALVLLIGAVLDGVNSTMTWYGNPCMMLLLYIIPTVCFQLLTTMFIQHCLRHRDLRLTKKIILQMHANRFLWTSVLLVGLITNVRSTYIIMIPVLFNIVGMSVIQCFRLHKYDSIWVFIYILFTILPTMHLMYFMQQLVGIFIPIMGRFGPNRNPEFVIGMILAILTTKIVSYFVPLVLFIRKQWHLLIFLLAVFLTGFIAALTPIGFPYHASEKHPALQRYSVFHTKRTFTNESGIFKKDAGFYFHKIDRNEPNAIANHVTSLANATSVKEDCKLGIACGFPELHSGMSDNDVWIPADLPVFPNGMNYVCLRVNSPSNHFKYQCSITGAKRIEVYLSIRPGLKLISLNLVDYVPAPAFKWNGQSTYHISFVSGKGFNPLRFTYVLEHNGTHNGTTTDLAIIGKFIFQDAIDKTDEYTGFLEEFPDWVVFENQGLANYEMQSIY